MGSRHVTLCCSLAAEPALAPVAMGLRGHGVNVEIVSGVEDEPRALGAALDESPDELLVVLCQDRAMDRGTVRRMEGVFSARRGPGHRMAVLPLRSGDPDALVREILERLEGATPLRESRRSAPSGPDSAAAPPRKGGAAGAGPKGAGGLLQEVEDMERALSAASASIPAPPPEASPRPTPDPVVAPARAASAPVRAAGVAAVSEPARGKILWALGGAALAVLVGVVAVTATRDSRETNVRPPAPGSREAAAGAPPPRAEASREVDEPPSPAPAREPAPGAGEEAKSPGEPAELAAPAPVGRGDGGSGEAALSYPEREEIVIARALSKGVVRGINRLIWVPPAPDELPFTQAREVCASLVRGGVGNFRLPRAPEARLLRRARMLDKGVYWTTTPVPEDAAALQALDTAQVPMARLPRATGRARAVCVRKHGQRI